MTATAHRQGDRLGPGPLDGLGDLARIAWLEHESGIPTAHVVGPEPGVGGVAGLDRVRCQGGRDGVVVDADVALHAG